MKLLHNNYFLTKMGLPKIKTWIDPCTYNSSVHALRFLEGAAKDSRFGGQPPKKLNTRMSFNIYFKTVAPLPFSQKCLISPPTAILFLHGKGFTERDGWLLMPQ